jgi:hypothetical protein
VHFLTYPTPTCSKSALFSIPRFSCFFTFFKSHFFRVFSRFPKVVLRSMGEVFFEKVTFFVFFSIFSKTRILEDLKSAHLSGPPRTPIFLMKNWVDRRKTRKQRHAKCATWGGTRIHDFFVFFRFFAFFHVLRSIRKGHFLVKKIPKKEYPKNTHIVHPWHTWKGASSKTALSKVSKFGSFLIFERYRFWAFLTFYLISVFIRFMLGFF